MGQVLPFVRREAAFDLEATEILIAAYQTAIERIADRLHRGALREIVARRIIALASRGERSPERLCAAARATIGRTESAVGEQDEQP
jgi:hypothetical protein